MRVFTMMPMRHWREAGPFAAAAEEAGFDALMTAELAHDVFTPLAFAALATARIELTLSIATFRAARRSWRARLGPAGELERAVRAGARQPGQGHNERRFGTSPPAPRLRDYARHCARLAVLGEGVKL
jgi:hypothetical protein